MERYRRWHSVTVPAWLRGAGIVISSFDEPIEEIYPGGGHGARESCPAVTHQKTWLLGPGMGGHLGKHSSGKAAPRKLRGGPWAWNFSRGDEPRVAGSGGKKSRWTKVLSWQIREDHTEYGLEGWVRAFWSVGRRRLQTFEGFLSPPRF